MVGQQVGQMIGVTQSCMEGKKSNRRTPVSQTDVVERFCCVRGSGNSRHPRRRRSKGKNEGGRSFSKGNTASGSCASESLSKLECRQWGALNLGGEVVYARPDRLPPCAHFPQGKERVELRAALRAARRSARFLTGPADRCAPLLPRFLLSAWELKGSGVCQCLAHNCTSLTGLPRDR